MTPNVFLSLSGQDDEFAERVWKLLPRGLATFYRRSFGNGAALLAEMEKYNQQASVFVLLASRASIQSAWVNFEIDQARLQQITDANHRLLVFPVESGVTARDLPSWMQKYWVPSGIFNPQDVSRHVLNVLLELIEAAHPGFRTIFGRGPLLDKTIQLSMEAVLREQRSPNVFLLSGFNQIGRRSFSQQLLNALFPTLPNINGGPTLELPLFGDILDLYQALRAQIDQEVTVESVEANLIQFKGLDQSAQVSEIVSSLEHFGSLGQAVTIVIGQGLFNADGSMKLWSEELISRLGARPDLVLVFVTFRQMRAEAALRLSNCLPLYVPPLSDGDVKALITYISSRSLAAPIKVSSPILSAVGGHPVVARSVVRLVEQRGYDIVEKQPFLLFGIQEQLLSENLDVSVLTPLQLDIMSLLSWVPALDGAIIEKTLGGIHPTFEVDFIREMEDLLLACLAQVSGNGYSISSAVRSMFRRKHGFGREGLLSSFSKVLANEWTISRRGGSFNPQLLDAFVFMVALEGRALPTELRSLLSPATLEEVVRETYARGKYEESLLRQVVQWGAVADEMRMDEATREQILSLVIRAHVRLREWTAAESLLKTFSERGYRTTFELRGFLLRRSNRLRDAVLSFKEALRRRPRDKSLIQELATCYARLGDTERLESLTKDNADVVSSNATLLDFKIGILVSRAHYKEAESAIRTLASLPENEGRSIIRQSQIIMQRDRDYRRAYDILTDMLENDVGDPITVRRWRSIAAGRAGKYDEANADISYIAGKVGKQDTAQRLRTRLELSRRDAVAARKEFGSILERTSHDQLLEAGILELEAESGSRSLVERDRLKTQAAKLREQARGVIEMSD